MFIETAKAETDTITIENVEETIANPPAESDWVGSVTGMIPIILISLVFYFFLIRPQEKKRRDQEQLVSSVKKGEEVLTKSGLFGKVLSINDSDNTVILQLSENVEVKILKDSISNIVKKEDKRISKNSLEKLDKKQSNKKKKTLTKAKK